MRSIQTFVLFQHVRELRGVHGRLREELRRPGRLLRLRHQVRRPVRLSPTLATRPHRAGEPSEHYPPDPCEQIQIVITM